MTKPEHKHVVLYPGYVTWRRSHKSLHTRKQSLYIVNMFKNDPAKLQFRTCKPTCQIQLAVLCSQNWILLESDHLYPDPPAQIMKATTSHNTQVFFGELKRKCVGFTEVLLLSALYRNQYHLTITLLLGLSAILIQKFDSLSLKIWRLFSSKILFLSKKVSQPRHLTAEFFEIYDQFFLVLFFVFWSTSFILFLAVI